MHRYRVSMSFHTDVVNPQGIVTIADMTLMINGKDQGVAITTALEFKDSVFPTLKLRNINCYEW